MQIIKSPRQLQKKIRQLRQKKKSVGFVPTMGALHEGHLSLLRRARKENDVCILSIFVNPKQFGPKEDFKKYPRSAQRDKLLAKKEKVDIIFYPSKKLMYPKNFLTYVEVDQISSVLCGKSRPGHFRGVTTIVSKLLHIIDCDVLYLGQKDAQQAIILKRMVADLNFPTTIRICPTVREKDGLACSSRNKYLTSKQRNEAVFLFRSLKQAKKRIKSGERDSRKILDGIRSNIQNNTNGHIDYVACVNAETLVPQKTIKGNILLALAVRFSKARLIDNIIVRI